MKLTYLLINLSDNKVVRRNTAENVALYLWGKRIDNYLVVKLYGETKVLVDWSKLIDANLRNIEKLCEES